MKSLLSSTPAWNDRGLVFVTGRQPLQASWLGVFSPHKNHSRIEYHISFALQILLKIREALWALLSHSCHFWVFSCANFCHTASLPWAPSAWMLFFHVLFPQVLFPFFLHRTELAGTCPPAHTSPASALSCSFFFFPCHSI